jgi:hypothetical protein
MKRNEPSDMIQARELLKQGVDGKTTAKEWLK